VGVVITNDCTTYVQPERAVPTAAMDLYCSVLLAGKSWSGHGGNSHSERDSKAALFLTIIVSITFVRTEGGVKCAAQIHKEKIIKYLNYPKFWQRFLTHKM